MPDWAAVTIGVVIGVSLGLGLGYILITQLTSKDHFWRKVMS